MPLKEHEISHIIQNAVLNFHVIVDIEAFRYTFISAGHTQAVTPRPSLHPTSTRGSLCYRALKPKYPLSRTPQETATHTHLKLAAGSVYGARVLGCEQSPVERKWMCRDVYFT